MYVMLLVWACSLPGDASHVVLSAASAAAPAADDDDVDLFGDDEDPEAEKKWEEEMERRAKEGQAKIDARNAAAGKKVVGKSSVLMDVKPWDDETGTLLRFWACLIWWRS